MLDLPRTLSGLSYPGVAAERFNRATRTVNAMKMSILPAQGAPA